MVPPQLTTPLSQTLGSLTNLLWNCLEGVDGSGP